MLRHDFFPYFPGTQTIKFSLLNDEGFGDIITYSKNAFSLNLLPGKSLQYQMDKVEICIAKRYNKIIGNIHHMLEKANINLQIDYPNTLVTP